MKSPFKMYTSELRSLCLKKGIQVEKTAKKAELLELLGFSGDDWVDDPDEPEKKKGKPSWKPAAKLSIFQKKPGFRYRWCDKDALNIQRKTEEGWVFVNSETGLPAEHERPDGKPLTSATEYRELVVMALDEETAQARDDYFREQTRMQTVSLKERLQSDLDKSAEARRSIKTQAEGTIIIN